MFAYSDTIQTFVQMTNCYVLSVLSCPTLDVDYALLSDCLSVHSESIKKFVMGQLAYVFAQVRCYEVQNYYF